MLRAGVEENTNRCRGLYLVYVGQQARVGSLWNETTGIGRLISHQQKPAPGGEAEIPGRFPSGGFMCQEFEFPRFRVHGIYNDTVVPPVGSVQEFPVGRDVDIRACIVCVEIPRVRSKSSGLF